MGKRVFWIFLLTVAVLTTGALAYIQSEHFARIVRKELQERGARSLGLDLEFERLRIGILPPSLSLMNVKAGVAQFPNRLGLDKGARFTAGSVGFSFRMIQAFGSGLLVNKVFLNDAELQLRLPRPQASPAGGPRLSALVHRPLRIDLSDNFFISVRQLEVRNTRLDLTLDSQHRLRAEKIVYLALTPAREGTNLALNVEGLEVETPKLKERLQALRVDADVQRSLVALTNLDLQRRQAALHASGKLVGSIDVPLEAHADVDLILRGSVAEFSELEKKLSEIDGELLAEAKVVGRLRDPAVQGRVELSRFRYGLWELERLELNGSYGAGTLVLDSLQAANGEGRLSLRNKLELQIPFRPETTAVQLRLQNARFEDFAGELRRSVNNLRMRLDGTLNARLEFAESGGKSRLTELTLKPDLQVKDLELNNQVFRKSRPYKRIFRVAPFQLLGNVQIRGGVVTVRDSLLRFSTGELTVNGTHTETAGYDLKGVSPAINLGAEVSEIAGLPIRGEGGIGIHVHGADEAVKISFDLDQRNANFVNFDFGSLEGKVVYDDNADRILIPGAKGRHGDAAYSLSGRVELGDSEAISLDAVFTDSPPDDVFAIFAHQLQRITWLPRGMTGALSARAKVGGSYGSGLDSLEIDARLTGRNLAYRGELLHELEAHAGVSKGVIFAREAKAKKYETLLSGWIDYELKSESMKYRLEAPRGKLRSIDLLGSLGLPVDGIFSLWSEGRGRWETLQSSTRVEVSSAFVRTRPVPQLKGSYDTTGDSSAFRLALGDSTDFHGKISHAPRAESYAELSVRQGNYDFLLCLLSRSNCTDPMLGFSLRADGRFTWRGWDWTAMNGSGQLQELQLARSGFSLRVPSPVRIQAQEGMLESGGGVLEGEESRLAFRARGKVDGSALDNSLKGSLSLKALEFLTPLIEEARGRLQLDLALTGNIRNASFRGGVSMEDGLLRLAGLDAPLESLELNLRVRDSHVEIGSLQGQLGGGSARASGGLELFLNRPPRFAIDLFLANNRLKFEPVTFAEFSDARLSFSGDSPPYLFSGVAHAKRVMMRNNFDIAKGRSLKNAKYLPEKVAGAKSFYEVKIRAFADGGIFVENDLLNAEFKGEATLLNNFEFPQIVGRADLVRGKLLFRNTAFNLDYASIRVPNRDFFDPMYQVGGATTVDNYRINLAASGTVERPKITFVSSPPLPREDIVSLLVFGYRGEDARRLNPNDNSALTYSEVSSILLEQLQLSQSLQSKGLRVTVAPSFNDTEANVVRPDSAVTAAPKVYVQTQVMKNLEAVLGGTVGAAQGQTMDAKLEYSLSASPGRRTSVRGIYEQSPTGLDATETKNSYGADLKFRWEFK